MKKFRKIAAGCCGFLLCVCIEIVALSGCAPPLQQTYEKSIKNSAVRGADWDTPLWPLQDGPVSVSTFTEDAQLDVRSLYVWVGTTPEIWKMCHGRRDPVLRLQQLLGLPPQKNPQPGNRWHLFVFDLDSRDLIRPCPGGVDERVPEQPRCRLSSDLDPQLDPELTRFMLQQWWLSHRSTVELGRDPELGYPWTGMGWTYDWDPASPGHRGVSEFIVKKSAVIDHLRTISPADFCSAARPPIT